VKIRASLHASLHVVLVRKHFKCGEGNVGTKRGQCDGAPANTTRKHGQCGVCVCVCVCARACVRACVCVCVLSTLEAPANTDSVHTIRVHGPCSVMLTRPQGSRPRQDQDQRTQDQNQDLTSLPMFTAINPHHPRTVRCGVFFTAALYSRPVNTRSVD